LAAAGEILPDLTEAVSKSMTDSGVGHPPWEIG